MDKDTKLVEEGTPLKICLCAFPFASESVHVHLFKFIELIEPVADKLHVIAGRILQNKISSQRVHIIDLKITMHFKESIRPLWLSILMWIVKCAVVQLRMSYELIRIANHFDIVIFHYGVYYSIPIIVARILRKRVVKLFLNPAARELGYGRTSPVYYTDVMFDKIACTFSDRLIMGTEASIRRFGMDKYRSKILVSNYRYWYLDDIFKIKNDLHTRKKIVGYVGRLRKEKGVLELVRAIPLILSRKGDVRFLIVGDGVLKDAMKKELQETGSLDKVDFVGEVPNNRIPDFLNEMRFHIISSHFELSGAVNLEAMACGAIVIANSVGGVPDIVVDNKTGFLLKDNLPETIANKVIEVWDHPELEKIQKNAKAFVEENFSYQNAAEYWRRILREL